MVEFNKTRATKVVTEWIEDAEQMVEDMTNEGPYETVEDLLNATGSMHEDLQAMKGLREHLEQDCE